MQSAAVKPHSPCWTRWFPVRRIKHLQNINTSPLCFYTGHMTQIYTDKITFTTQSHTPSIQNNVSFKSCSCLVHSFIVMLCFLHCFPCQHLPEFLFIVHMHLFLVPLIISSVYLRPLFFLFIVRYSHIILVIWIKSRCNRDRTPNLEKRHRMDVPAAMSRVIVPSRTTWCALLIFRLLFLCICLISALMSASLPGDGLRGAFAEYVEPRRGRHRQPRLHHTPRAQSAFTHACHRSITESVRWVSRQQCPSPRAY